MGTDVYENVNKDKKKLRPLLRQMFMNFTSMSVNFMLGLSAGTPTVAVPQLRQQANSTTAVSEDMASWITSITPYSGIIWVFMTTIFAHHIGRRKAMIITGLNTLTTFLIVYYSENVLHIFISQFMQGITQASVTTVCMMISTEFTSAKYRGVFMTLKSASVHWGMWVANATGTFFHYRYIGIVGIICTVYNFITIIFMPESPYWLACQGKYDECAAAHRWLKGRDEESEKELDALIKSRKEENDETSKLSIIGYMNHYARVLREPNFFKPVILSLLVIGIFNFSGKMVCAIYALEIMKQITSSTSAAYTAVLILDGFTVAGTYVGCIISKFLKRKTLLIGASSGCAAFLLLLSIYLYLAHLTILSENQVVSVILLVGYSLSASFGPLILAITLFGELYPVKHRSFAICVISIESKLALGTLAKFSPYMFKTFSLHGTFLFFGVMLLFCLFLTYRYLPETKDKTLQEIADYFGTNPSKSEVAESTPLRNLKS